MCKSAGVIHDFMPASGILRVAEAVLRVFQRLGDYKHKQRNRMKFMIKELGWDRWKAEYDRALACVRGRRRCRSSTIDPPVAEAAPAWTRDEAPSPNLIASRVAAAPPDGPGITPTLVPVYMPGDEAYARWRATNVRPQKQFGYVIATATVPLGDLTSEQMRVLGELARAYSDGTVRVTVDQDLVFRWVQRRRRSRAVSPAVGRQPRAGGSVHRRRRHQLPGRRVVPAGRHAVARPRPAARGSPAARGLI